MKSPLGAATTQSPTNVPNDGVTVLRQRKIPFAVYEVTTSAV